MKFLAKTLPGSLVIFSLCITMAEIVLAGGLPAQSAERQQSCQTLEELYMGDLSDLTNAVMNRRQDATVVGILTLLTSPDSFLNRDYADVYQCVVNGRLRERCFGRAANTYSRPVTDYLRTHVPSGYSDTMYASSDWYETLYVPAGRPYVIKMLARSINERIEAQVEVERAEMEVSEIRIQQDRASGGERSRIGRRLEAAETQLNQVRANLARIQSDVAIAERQLARIHSITRQLLTEVRPSLRRAERVSLDNVTERYNAYATLIELESCEYGI